MTPSGGTSQPQAFDGNGNLTSDNNLTYTYDPENRLMKACNTSGCTGTMSAAYAYDPLGRRQEKSGTGVTGTFFLQDGADEIAEYNTSGALQRRFVPGPAIDDTIAMVPASGTTELFYTDHHGRIVATSDASGNLLEGPYVYNSYGNCYLGTAQTTRSTQTATNEPFKFTGQYYDIENGCYYYRARIYCADTVRGGRFLQTDPVGYESDLNLYAFVGSDPTDAIDPSGLDGNSCSRVGASDCSGSYSGDGTSAQRFGATYHLGGVQNAGVVLAAIAHATKYEGQVGPSQAGDGESSGTKQGGAPGEPSSVNLIGDTTHTVGPTSEDGQFGWNYNLQIVDPNGVPLVEGYSYVQEHIIDPTGNTRQTATPKFALRGMFTDFVGLDRLGPGSKRGLNGHNFSYQHFIIIFNNKPYNISTVFLHDIIPTCINDHA